MKKFTIAVIMCFCILNSSNNMPMFVKIIITMQYKVLTILFLTKVFMFYQILFNNEQNINEVYTLYLS